MEISNYRVIEMTQGDAPNWFVQDLAVAHAQWWTPLCDTLCAMKKEEEVDEASAGRLQRFAEIYREKMKARPYMELLARYDSMTEAGLLVRERVKADLYLDTHRMNELLYPGAKIKLVSEK